MVTEVSCGETSPTVGCVSARRGRGQEGKEKKRRTVDAIDAYDIFQNGGALVWGLPVQQHAVGLDGGERNERCDGYFQAEQVDELFDGLGENLVGSEGDPM